MAGLVRRKVVVRTKRGRTYTRSVLVRAGELARKHSDKVLAAAALTAATLAARKYGSSAGSKITAYRRGAGANLAGHLVRKGLTAAAEHIAGKIGIHVGTKFGAALSRIAGRKHRESLKAFGAHVGESIGEAAAGYTLKSRIDKLGARTTARLRKKKLVG